MDIFFRIITPVLMSLSIYLSFLIESRKWYKVWVMASLQILILITTFLAIQPPNIKNIQPIDVYRGKTKLQIVEKVVNGEVIERDSIVVLINK